MREWDYTNERVLFWMDLNGDFKWVCSTITSQNVYGPAPTIILLTMRPSRLFVKIRFHAVLSIRKRSAVRNEGILKSHSLLYSTSWGFGDSPVAGVSGGQGIESCFGMSRTRLLENVSPSDLPESMAWRVIGRLESGQTQRSVADAVGVARSVVARLWNRFKK
ncbi:core histone macro-H2A.1 [Trichonephila clavipes]|nr:core histone macro-H2A.1 [Trichonephila clavipes]